MNQDVHALLTVLGKHGETNDKEETMEYSEKYLGIIGILDSFRCRMPRQATHFTGGSYWKMPETLEELKNSKPEDMEYFISEYSKDRIEKKACVDESVNLKNLVKNNLGIFKKGNDENYGRLLMAHALQDFYSDSVWRLLYNFNNQTEIILKTEERIPEVNPNLNGGIESDKEAAYHKLGDTVGESDKKFRDDYRNINCYVSYLLSKELEKRGYEVWEDEDNNLFKKVLGSYENLYPEDVFSSCKKYITYLPETKEAVESQDATELKEEVESIFGENPEMFLKVVENMVLSYSESGTIYAQLQDAIEKNGGEVSDEVLDTIFQKQIQMVRDMQEYEENAYNKYFENQEHETKPNQEQDEEKGLED